MQMGKLLKIKGSSGGRSRDRTADLLLVSYKDVKKRTR